MTFFKRKVKIRRHSDTSVINGYHTAAWSEFYADVNVQESNNNMRPNEEGKSDSMSITTYSDCEFKIADNLNQANADMLEYNSNWYECVSCVFYDNTILKHYTSQWNRLPEGVR